VRAVHTELDNFEIFGELLFRDWDHLMPNRRVTDLGLARMLAKTGDPEVS
jgi:hypothetical protein